MLRAGKSRGLEGVIENYNVIIDQLKGELEKEQNRAEQLKRKQQDAESAISALEAQVVSITQQRTEERSEYVAEIERLRDLLAKKQADLQVANAKLFQTSLHQRDAVEQRLVRRMSSVQLAKMLQSTTLPGQEHKPLSDTGVPQLWMNAQQVKTRPLSAKKEVTAKEASAHRLPRPSSALSMSRTSSSSKEPSPSKPVGKNTSRISRTPSGGSSGKPSAGRRGSVLGQEEEQEEVFAGQDEEAEEYEEEEKSVVVCEWLLTMEGILAQTRGLKKRNLSLVVDMPRMKIWGTDPAVFLHTQPMTIKYHRRAVYDAIGKALRGNAEGPELLLSAVDSISAHQRKRQVKEIGEMLRVLGSTVKVMDALLTSLLSPRPTTTTIQFYARAIKKAFGCEAVKLFRVDNDTQEVFSLLPPAPNSDGVADHYSLSESGIVPFVVREKVLLNIPYPASSYAYFDGDRDALPGAKHKLVDNMLCCPIYAPIDDEDAERKRKEEARKKAEAEEGPQKQRRRLFQAPKQREDKARADKAKPNPMDVPMWESDDNVLTFGKGADSHRCIAVLQLFNKKGRDFDLADEHLAFRAAGGLGPLIGRMQRKREEGELLEGASCLTIATQEFAPERDLLGRAVTQLLRALKNVLRGQLVDLWLVRSETSTDKTYLSKLRDVLGTKDTELGVRGERVYLYDDSAEGFVQSPTAGNTTTGSERPKESKGVSRAVIRSVAEKCKEWETPYEVAVPVVGQGGSCMGVIECSNRQHERADKNFEDDESVDVGITAQDIQLLNMIGREIGRALESSTHFCIAVPPPPTQNTSSVVQMMHGVLRSIGTIVKAERAVVFEVDRKSGTDLRLHPSQELHPEQSHFTLSYGQGIAGAATKHNRVVRVPMAKLHRWYHSSYDLQFDLRTEAVVCCPIMSPSSGVILGALEVANKIEGGLAFTSVDEVFIRAASDQLGRLLVMEEANMRRMPVRELLEEQRKRQESNWAAETCQRIFRAYNSAIVGDKASAANFDGRDNPERALLMRLSRRMALLPPRKFQRPPRSLPDNVEAQMAMSVWAAGDVDDNASVVSDVASNVASRRVRMRRKSSVAMPLSPSNHSMGNLPPLLAQAMRSSAEHQFNPGLFLSGPPRRLDSGDSDGLGRVDSGGVEPSTEDLHMRTLDLQRRLAAKEEEISKLKQSANQQKGRAKNTEEVKKLKGLLSDANMKHQELEKKNAQGAAELEVQVQHNSSISLQLSRSRRQSDLLQRQCQQLQDQIDLLRATVTPATAHPPRTSASPPGHRRKSTSSSPGSSPRSSSGRKSGGGQGGSPGSPAVRSRRASIAVTSPKRQLETTLENFPRAASSRSLHAQSERTEGGAAPNVREEYSFSGFEAESPATGTGSEGSQGSARGFSHGRERSLNLFVATEKDDHHGLEEGSGGPGIAPFGQ